MRRTAIAALVLGGAVLAASLPRLVRRERAAAPAVATTVAASAPVASTVPAPPAATDLAAMLAVGRRAREARAATATSPGMQRSELLAAIDRGPADARTGALRTLALTDRAAAEAVARARLHDHVLFAEAARLLLIRPGGAPAGDDVARVRRALRTGGHDEASRAAIASLVLETLAQRDSPAAPAFATALERDPGRRVQLAAARARRVATR